MIPCPMFPQVSPSLLALDFASLTTIAFCAPFVFMVLRIAFPATPLDSHLYKLPGGVGVKQAKPSVGFVQWTLTSLHSSTYKLFIAAKKDNSFVFSQIETLWAKHPGWVFAPLAHVPNLAPSQASNSVHSLASCRLPGLGAIIPLCTPNIRRCAFLSLADCPASLGGKTWLSALIGSTNEKHKQLPQMAIAICRRCILRGRASSPKRWSTSLSASISSPS